MKASRAPGPVQSYSILHNNRGSNAGGVGRGEVVKAKPMRSERQGNKTVPVEANQGILKQFRNLDDIPDLDSVGWGAPSASSARTPDSSQSCAHSSSTRGPSGLFQPWSQQQEQQEAYASHQQSPSSYYQTRDAPSSSDGRPWCDQIGSQNQQAHYLSPPHQRQQQPQPRSQYHYHSQDLQSDEVEEEYEDLGYCQADRSPPLGKHPPAGSRINVTQTEYGSEQVESDDEDIQEYASPRKGDECPFVQSRSGSASSQSKPKPVTVTMNKSQASAGKVGQVKIVAKPAPRPAVPSPKGGPAKLQSNPQAPPLPCEQPRDLDGGNSAATETEERSQLYFSKQPRPVEYKPYTLKQYNLIKPKEYVEISKMQPDLNTEELQAKRRNAERIKEFSKQLRSVNQDTLSQQRKLPPAAEQRDIEKSRQKISSNRQRALEFARLVPRPGGDRSPNSDPGDEEDDAVDGLCASLGNTRTSQSADGGRRGQGSSGKAGGVPAGQVRAKKSMRRDLTAVPAASEAGDNYEAAVRLAELEALHAQKKAQVDAIRRTMGK